MAIDDLEGLTPTICTALTKKPSKLTGAEFRYLRNGLMLSQPSQGQMLGVSGHGAQRKWAFFSNLTSIHRQRSAFAGCLVSDLRGLIFKVRMFTLVMRAIALAVRRLPRRVICSPICPNNSHNHGFRVDGAGALINAQTLIPRLQLDLAYRLGRWFVLLAS
ncbi:hypothetical protein [Limnohabitans planktonicus]|uniref:hypothetical protein n=1 Tax=Limnohabitans planktonicus TaxID=540060 RepID=UPI000A694FE2|nr:hypothetical protein [Limnohabitans planktonicus]